MRVADLEGVSLCQSGERSREILCSWHACSLHQHRYDTAVALQAGNDFQANQIILVGQAPAALVVGRGKPTRTNQDKHHVCYIDLLTHRFDKIFAGLDSVDFAVNALLAEMLREAIKQPPGMTDAVFAPVTDKDCRRSHRTNFGKRSRVYNPCGTSQTAANSLVAADPAESFPL